MRCLEEAAFRSGVSAEELMDQAGRRLGAALGRLVPGPGTAVAYIGKGNNGGDALVALRILREAGWKILVRSAWELPELGVLPRRKYRELGEPELRREPLTGDDLARPLLVIDGLLGIGGRGALRPPLAGMAAEMNALREQAGAVVAAVDLPSGLDGDTGEVGAGAVTADLTLTIGVPKTGLLADAATAAVGRLELIPLEELPAPAGGDCLVEPGMLRNLLPPRSFDMHKGTAGRVGLVAGSKGLLGAALLAARGALRGGAGLVTLYVSRKLYPLMVAAGPPPELMVQPVSSYLELLDVPLDALALGPGLGRPNKDDRKELLELLRDCPAPVVLDADGLNLVAESGPDQHLRDGILATPHPGEFRRLAPELASLDRAAAARAFVDRFSATLLLKGARTVMTAPGRPMFFNSTGTPGMAGGGQGDVLTGLLGALAARGLGLLDAASCGAWLAGRASEIAIASGGQSVESLLAGDTAAALGSATRELQGRT
jgi:hydroxyethylthiazole kinase-like uncharacterized protein yjeF